MWQAFGHKNQKKLLDSAIANNQYAHAYLFCGPSAVGKKALALEFAGKILGAGSAGGNVNPDLIILDQPPKIEDIRNLISALSLKPYFYERKVAIIDNFENATSEAANGILKTLEEPNSSTVIILVARSIKAVLPTIASRAQVVNFGRLSQDEMAQAAHKEAEKYLALFNGRIGKLVGFQENEDSRKKSKADWDALEKVKSLSGASRLSFMKGFAEMEAEELARLLDNWTDVEHSGLKNRPRAYKNLRLFINAAEGLRRNFNKKLILERVLLELA